MHSLVAPDGSNVHECTDDPTPTPDLVCAGAPRRMNDARAGGGGIVVIGDPFPSARGVVSPPAVRRRIASAGIANRAIRARSAADDSGVKRFSSARRVVGPRQKMEVIARAMREVAVRMAEWRSGEEWGADPGFGGALIRCARSKRSKARPAISLAGAAAEAAEAAEVAEVAEA